jgi:hypothetical protein
MSYQRIKRIGNNDYLYEQESSRDSDGVHTKHVRYIGKIGTTTSSKINASIKDESKANKDYNKLSEELNSKDAKTLKNIAKDELHHKKELEAIKNHNVVINKSKFHTIHPSHLDKPFDKNVVGMELNRHMIITIPSTQGQKHVSQKIIDSRARDVASKMTEEFGGSTRIKGQGQYYNKRYKKVDDENVVKVEVFMTKKQWSKEQPKIQNYLVSKQKAWKQEDLAVEYDKSDTMYFIHGK